MSYNDAVVTVMTYELCAQVGGQTEIERGSGEHEQDYKRIHLHLSLRVRDSSVWGSGSVIQIFGRRK